MFAQGASLPSLLQRRPGFWQILAHFNSPEGLALSRPSFLGPHCQLRHPFGQHVLDKVAEMELHLFMRGIGMHHFVARCQMSDV